MMKQLCAAVIAAFAIAAMPGVSQAQGTRLTVDVFAGLQNLPIVAAQANGFFAKRGLEVDLNFAPNSDELRNGLAEGRYQIVHGGVDNAFAMKDKANVDIAVVIGGDNGFNQLIVQPEITSVADIKGKMVAVDAVNTAYAFQLYEMLRQKGLNKGDYQIVPVGATPKRLEAMVKDKALVAAILNPPSTINARKAGLKSLGTAVSALGAYQATAAFARRDWAQANIDTLVKYLQAYIEGVRWTLDIKHKPEAISLMVERLKMPADVAEEAYMIAVDPKDGLAKDAALDMEGVKNVLKLRGQFENGTPAAAEKYIDLSYYQKALAGL